MPFKGYIDPSGRYIPNRPLRRRSRRRARAPLMGVSMTPPDISAIMSKVSRGRNISNAEAQRMGSYKRTGR
jgi:hypothetical protein